MPFTLKLQLKQHTPLLHFQHDQEGATLRATELKPKLDEYIIAQQGKALLKKFGADPEDDDKGALNYKLRISAEKGDEYIVGSSIPRAIREDLDQSGQKYLSDAPYFADNPLIKTGKWDEARRAVMYKNIEVEVFSFHEEVVELVRQALPYVLAYENFGTRQSKGFGSFSVAGTTVAVFEQMLTDRVENLPTYFYAFKTPNPSLRDIFKKIDSEYKILKSGFAPERSQMMLYFEGKGVHWEKPPIKDNLVKQRSVGIRKDLSADSKQKYIRALLGLAELYEFPHDRAKVNIECVDNRGVQVPPIDRFRSPMTFKVFENSIYILTHPIPDALYDRTFRFFNSAGEVLINTPPKSINFDLTDFLDKHIENSWKYVRS